MKKIMFNDSPFGLCRSVLTGQKTQTRRFVPQTHITSYEKNKYKYGVPIEEYLLRVGLNTFHVGEEVAIAQSYSSLGLSPNMVTEIVSSDKKSSRKAALSEQAGWRNKMYVSAEFMPHAIRIIGVRVERLQEISDSDVLAEGIVPIAVKDAGTAYGTFGTGVLGSTQHEAYATMLNRLSSKNVWKLNPLVYVYDFELLR
jgi:hypothetical protein